MKSLDLGNRWSKSMRKSLRKEEVNQYSVNFEPEYDLRLVVPLLDRVEGARLRGYYNS